MKKDPANVTRRKNKFGIHKRGEQLGHSDVEVGGRRERLDTAYDERLEEKRKRVATTKKPRDLDARGRKEIDASNQRRQQNNCGGQWPC